MGGSATDGENLDAPFDMTSADCTPRWFPRGVRVWVTTRAHGNLGWGSRSRSDVVDARWQRLEAALAAHGVPRVVSATQVHGADVVQHLGGWRGHLRLRGVDGHLTLAAHTALAVTVADCTPVLIAHPNGAIAALHAGWRGTAAGVLEVGIEAMAALGADPADLHAYLGPSICLRCYEVGAEVCDALGVPPVMVDGRRCADVRGALAARARALGVTELTIDPRCTRCSGGALFSHRGGDDGRQVALIART